MRWRACRVHTVANIEQCYADLATKRGTYMAKCKRIRETMAGDYDKASDKGISKKLLKRIIKEREHERKIFGLTDDLEPDERSDHEMLKDSCGYNGWIMSAVSQAIVVIQRL